MASDLGSTPIAVEFIRSGYRGGNQVAAGIANPTRSSKFQVPSKKKKKIFSNSNLKRTLLIFYFIFWID